MASKEKKKLRTILLAERKAKTRELSDSEVNFITNNITKIANNNQLRSIAVFWPFGSEINIKPVIKNLWDNNYQISLPKVANKGEPLHFFAFNEDTILIPNSRFNKLLEVQNNQEILPEIILIPLLGFNNQGYRLGFGGGFYDKTLKMLKNLYIDKKFVIIGIAFSWQKLDTIPVETHDEKLDYVLTENSLIKIGG